MPAVPMSYRQIADDLEARIRAEEYPPGAQLPSYAQIRDMYSVSMTTAQSAVRELRARGLVEGVPGRGVYVKE